MNKKVVSQEKILQDYENKAEEILQRMFSIVIRAQRKVDDVEYRQTLEKLDKKK